MRLAKNKGNRRGKRIEYKGKVYQSIKEFYDEFKPDITYETLVRRLYHGCPIEKAFKMVKPKPRIDSVFRNSACDLRQHKIKNLEDYAKSIGMKGYGFIWSY